MGNICSCKILRNSPILLCLLLLILDYAKAQKPALKIEDLGTFPTVSDPQISTDGKYASYLFSDAKGQREFVLKSLNNGLTVRFQNCRNLKFSDDSKFVAILFRNDSLKLINLTDQSKVEISNIEYYTFIGDLTKTQLLYRKKEESKDLYIFDFVGGTREKFENVTNFIADSSLGLVLFQKTITDSAIINLVDLKDFRQSRTKEIWRGGKITSLQFFKNPLKFAFFEAGLNKDNSFKALWLFNSNNFTKLIDVSGNQVPGVKSENIAGGSLRFNKSGSYLFIKNSSIPDIHTSNVGDVKSDVWSWKDEKLQSQQLIELSEKKPSLFSLSVETKKLVSLLSEGDEIVGSEEGYGNYIIVRNRRGDYHESNWNVSSTAVFILISLKDGKRTIITSCSSSFIPIQISPHENCVVYFDERTGNYFSYQIATGVKIVISRTSHTIWTDADNDRPTIYRRPVLSPIAGWHADGCSVFVYDNNDIWRLDLYGNKMPLCITSMYGKSTGVKFRILEQNSKVISDNEKLVLAAFNPATKQNGFYSILIGVNRNPERLSMGSCVYYWPNLSSFRPIKARCSDRYIVARMSATEANNYYLTDNFAHFIPLSENQPQAKYNWLKAELVNSRSNKGRRLSGVLYEPENFNPSKKYPVVIYLYEQLSDELNLFKTPVLSDGRMDIPFMVSNEYLVFTPDIKFGVGDVGGSIYESLTLALDFLTSKNWVDNTRIGIQGHSFGGYEVNYIIGKTKRFAAAASASGFSDLISFYGSIMSNGISKQFQFETGQCRIGSTIWGNPTAFLKSSPIINADRISTPLLMLNNRKDETVSFSQGVELFTALRRLKKSAWMLQYDDGTHQLTSFSDKRSYSIRLFQFFNHYLKGFPAPVWMTRGIPARLKGYEGYELDTSSYCNQECKICITWKNRMQKDPIATFLQMSALIAKY